MTPNEPNAIALLRQGVYVPDAADCDAILQTYDTIVAERDAAVHQIKIAKVCNDSQAELIERLTLEKQQRFDELNNLRARLAACERVVEAAGAYLSVIHPPKPENYAEFKAALSELVEAERTYRAAVTAETQGATSNPYTTGSIAMEHNRIVEAQARMRRAEYSTTHSETQVEKDA